MTFIVIAPGMRDVIASAEAFAARSVEQTQPVLRTRQTPAPDDEHLPTEQQMLNRRPQVAQAQRRYEETAELPHERAPALVAEQIMTAPVHVLGPDATLVEAWALFRDQRIGQAPIVDDDRRIIGILSERDLLLDAAGVGPESTTRHTTIRPLVERRFVTATPSTEIREIASLLYEQHMGAMPIVNASDCPIGIVSRSDILHALVTQAPLELWV